MAKDKVDELYDALKADGLVEKDRDNFRSYMLAPGEEGYRNRMKLYNALMDDGLVSSKSYEEFRDRLGLVAKNPVAGKDSLEAPAPTQTHPLQQPATSAVHAVSDNTAQQATVPTTAQPDQPEGWKPSPMQKQYMQRQVDQANARLKKMGEDFHQRMEGIEKGNRPGAFMGEREFNPGTGEMETAYYTTQGERVPTSMQQRKANRDYHQWWENNTEAGQRSKEQRLQREFDARLSGLWQRHNPPEGENAAEQAWSAAEKRQGVDRNRIAEEIYHDRGDAMSNAALLGGPQNRIMNAAGNSHRSMVARFTNFDLDRLMNDSWDNLGEDGQKALIDDCYQMLRYRNPGADELVLYNQAKEMARKQSDLRLYNLAVEKNLPKGNLEYLMRKIGDMNLLMNISKGVAVSGAKGKTGDMAAYEAANEQYRQDGHKVLDVTGMVAGFALDPTTWLSAGVGGAASKGAMWTGGRFLAGRGASSAVSQAATRQFATTMTGRIVGGVAGGAANFGTFEGVKELENQFAHGGHIVGQDEVGRYINEGYSAGAVGGQALHGLMMGGAVGWLGPVSGNVSDQLVRATSSTLGKVATRAGVYTGATLAEGTIFSVPEWIEGERDAMDVWSDNMAMMVGFKAKHILKSAGGVLGDLKASFDSPTNGQKNRLDFESRLRQRMDAPSDGGIALTEDEKAELQRYGYDLRDLVESAERTGDAAEGSLIAQNAPEIVSRLTDMVADPRVSEAARAKMYYYATGRRLPMSTVMKGELIEDGKGGFIVESQGANGVITSRSFKSRKAADLELERIKRQTELNTIEIGERYQQIVDVDNRMQEASRRVAAKYGWDPVEVYKTYETVRDNSFGRGESNELTEVQKNIYGKIISEFEQLKENKDLATEKRNAINEKYGVDIDGAISKEANRRTLQEQTAIDEYIEALIPSRAKVSFSGPKLLEGENLMQKVEEAEEVEATEVNDEHAVRQAAAESEPVDPRFDNSTDPTPDYDPHQPGGEQAPIGRAVMKYQDRPVEVLSGRVVMMEDGTMIDNERSDASIVIRDLATGKVEMVSPEAILTYEEYTSPTEEAEPMPTEVEAAVGDVQPQSQYTSGQIKIRNSDGTETRGVLTGYVDENGNHEYYVEGDLHHLHYASDHELDNILSEYVPDEVEAEATAGNPAAPGTKADETGVSDVTDVANEAQGEALAVAPTETPEEAPAGLTALERLPKNKKGEPIFEQAENPEEGWDALVEFSEGDAATAKEIADTMAEEKRKAYEKAQKQKSKGKTPTEILASKKEIAAALAQAEQEYNIWKQMAGVEQRRQDAIRAQQEAEARQRAAERAEAKKAEREAREEAARLEREALEGIPEWHLDTPENARKRGVRRFSGQMFTRQEPVDGVVGNEVEVKFSQSDLPQGRVIVIDASQLQPSHIQGQRNPMFFIEEAQPKNRAEAVSKTAAKEMAENIRPQEITGSATAYTGAPTVNARGEVIQGNNRSDALRYLWDSHRPKQQQTYKQYLIDNAEQFGIDPEAVNAMQQPVLVNMLDVDDAEAIRLGQMTAQDTESGGVERIKPKNVAQKLGEDMRMFASQLLRSGDEEASFGQLVDRNGAEVLKWMAQRGIISDTQYQSTFDSKGNLTAEAKNDLQKVLYQAVFKGGSQQLEEMFDALPAKAQRAILSTAFRDMDSPFAGKMLPEIQASIAAYHQLMRDPAFAASKKLEDLLRAVEAFKQATALDDRFEQYVPADNFSNFALHLAAMYKAGDMSQTTLAGYFNQMYDLAQGKKAATLFEEADTTEYPLADVIQQVLNIDYQPAKNGDNDVANGGADVALRNQDVQGGELRGNEPPASGEQNPAGTEPSERGGGTVLPQSERGGQGDVQHPQRQQQDNTPQESEEISYSLSDEVDENGHQFVLNSKGELAFGQITPDTTLPSAPILLSEGMITNKATNAGYGLVHIEARHGAEIRKAGYNSVLDFIEEVAQNYEVIKEGHERDGIKTYMLQLTDKHNNTLMVELSGDGTYWNINTAGIFKTSYGANRKEVYNRHTTVKQPAETAVESPESAQSGTSDSARMNSATTSSDGKVNNSVLEKQGTGSESSRGALSASPQHSPDESDSAFSSHDNSVQPSDNKGGQTIQTAVEAASAQVNTEPTPAQAEAGNYKKGHVTIGEFDISIENPAGSLRKGVDADGKEWSTQMANTYGYIKGTEGVDGDHIDVFLHSDMDQWNGRKVYVVDQTNTDGTFDEHKVMLGFNDKDEAMKAYLANYDKAWADTHPGLRISETGIGDFNRWVQSSHRKRKPFSEYRTIEKESVDLTPDNGAAEAAKPRQKSSRLEIEGAEKLSAERRGAVERYAEGHYCVPIRVISDEADIRALGLSERATTQIMEALAVQDIPAFYCREDKKVYIFAGHKDSNVGSTLAHENFHALADAIGNTAARRRIFEVYRKTLFDDPKCGTYFKELWEAVSKAYSAEDALEDFVAYTINRMYSAPGFIEHLDKILDDDVKEYIFNNFINRIFNGKALGSYKPANQQGNSENDRRMAGLRRGGNSAGDNRAGGREADGGAEAGLTAAEAAKRTQISGEPKGESNNFINRIFNGKTQESYKPANQEGNSENRRGGGAGVQQGGAAGEPGSEGRADGGESAGGEIADGKAADGMQTGEPRRRYGAHKAATTTGMSLFDWADAEERGRMGAEAKDEKTIAAEDANSALDSFAESYSRWLEHSAEVEAQLDAEGVEGELRDDLTAQMESEETRIAEERQKLEEKLRDYYAIDNTPEDATRIARDMVGRILAEVEIRYRKEHILSDLLNGSDETPIETTSDEAAAEEKTAKVRTGGGFISYTALGHLPDAREGEFAYVERKFSRTGEFSFTGADKIHDRGDVAYLFRSLENYSVENVFAVLVKDGKARVLHIGMGTATSSLADMSAIRAGVDAFGADRIYLVHNHPSGTMIASQQDRNLMRTLEDAFGDKIDVSGIIIDTTSGRYVEFDGDGQAEVYDRPRQSDGEEMADVFRFDQADRSNMPEETMAIRSSSDVANAIGKLRFGDGMKVSYLILAHNGHAIGNFHTEYTSINDRGLAEEMASVASKYGGTSVVAYGNMPLDGAMRLKDAVARHSLGGVRLLDTLGVRNGIQMSAVDEGMLYEGGSEYGATYVQEPDGTEIEETNKRFNEELERQIAGTLPEGHIYQLGKPGRVLQSTGVPYLPIQMSATRLEAKATQYGHNFDLTEIKNLVKELQKPMAIFRYGDKGKMQNIIIGIESNGKQFIVGLSLNPIVNGKSLEINSVRNVFPKNNAEWLNWISQGKLLYADKEKIQALIDKQRTILADVDYLDLEDVAKVVKEFENPTIEDAKIGADLRYREVEDDAVLREFAEGKTVKAYRTMQVIDGKLYSPMATKVGGKATPEIKLGVPEQAEEHPEIIKRTKVGRDGVEVGYVVIDKGLGKGTLEVAYNPSIHASLTPLNDQFTSADIRPNLVIVETLIPKSELTSGYRAPMAKDAVGEMSWHSGTVSGKLAELGKPRRVILSRYDMPVRIVPFKEVAQMIAAQLEGTDIDIPYNVVTPQVRMELQHLGIAISDTPSGSVGENRDFGKAEYITDQEIERINAHQQGMAQTSPEAKSSHAEKLAKKFNTPIQVVTDTNELTSDNTERQARMRRSKGFYNPATGKVVVVLPNNANVEDVAETVFHEVVAHKGLREMLGEENYEAFCDEIYDHLKDDLKEDVDRETTRRFEYEPENGYEHHRRVSVDEMFGRMAEKGFEDFTKAERSIWAKLKAKVLEAINRFLGSLKLPKWVSLGDNELRYMLWRSHERLSGKGDYVDMARDAAKREEWGLNRSEVIVTRSKVTTADRIEEAFDAAVAGDLKGKPVEIGSLTKEGREYLEKLSGVRMKEDVSFVLNPSDMMHMYRDHFGDNEKDKGNNIPLTKDDIRAIARVISSPERVIFGKEPDGLKRNLFYFLAPADEGAYNLLEIYGDRKGNLTAKTYYKTRKGVSQRALSLKKSEHLTSVTDGATLSDGTNLPKFFDTATIAGEESFEYRFRDVETGDIWKDHSVGLQERITNAAIRLSNNQSGDLTLRNDAMKAIGGNLTSLRKAMAAQKQFDRSTVKRVSDLARILMQNGYLSGMTSGEVQRLLSAVKNSVGHKDVDKSVQQLMDIMVNNQLRNAEGALRQLLSIRGSKVDARGVEVQGVLDMDGQRTMEVVKKAMSLSEDDITDRIAEALNRISDPDKTIADQAALEYAGLNMALDYVQNIAGSKSEEKTLRDSLKTAKEDRDAGRMTDDAYKQFVEATEDAIRKNKVERAEAYFNLVGRLSDSMRESIENAKAFRESEKARISEIHHNANSDMEGRPTNEHHKDDWKDKFVNNGFVQFLFAPLGTFDQILRVFGNKSVNGEGYLWNRFMRGWVDCRNKELTGVKEKFARLDEKAAELFGKGKTWGNLIRMEAKMPKATVSFWDGGEMRDHELTQGNLLYIYMVDKMTDGRMKLRRMGITESDIAKIENFLDPRFKALGDWLQDEFLVDTRNEYNETHKRMFGASMAAIENYFPLKILANARVDKEEDVNQQNRPDGITTKTGSIIKRRVNNLALDITGADALSVILDHITQMEHWSAYAEWNRDLNTLRTYKRFRNQVINMTTVYGGGRKLWENFNDLCLMAAGEYSPPVSKLNKSAVNIAKGVTAAKVSFRMYTALKQLLSAPAYIPEISTAAIAKSIANPYGDFKWCLENMPIFRERWHSRISGDPRLLKSDMDWKMWRSRIMELSSRIGMTPNAFVDAVTVSIGARAMYETRLKQYLKEGYPTDAAEKRAMQDATILFNQTQQSSESPFLSTMQVDKDWLSTLFTVFRNSSMSYTRQEFDAMRNLKRNLTPGQRAKSIEFMTKQILRDWDVDPDTATDAERDQAQGAAKKRFHRQLKKDVLRVATFGYILEWLWNLGPYLPYIIFGNDEDEKDKMWDDAMTHALFGSVEGLTGGDVTSSFGNMWASGEWNWNQLSKDMPLASDISTIRDKFIGDKNAEAVNDILNLSVQMGVGMNPQSITDTAIAITDACGDDPALSHEAAIFVMRVLQVPQSQNDKMYFDEVDLTGEEASKFTPAQLAQRYAEYRVKRGTPLAPWSWGDEERLSKYNELAKDRMQERLDTQGDVKVIEAYVDFEARYKAVSQQVKAVKKLMETDYVAGAQAHAALQQAPDFGLYRRFGALDKQLGRISKMWLTAKTPEEATLIASTLSDYRAAMVRALQADTEESQQSALSELTTLMNDFYAKYQGMQPMQPMQVQ